MRSELVLLAVLASTAVGAWAAPAEASDPVALFVSGHVLADCVPGCRDTLTIVGGVPLTTITLPLGVGLDGSYQLDAGLPQPLTPGSYDATLEVRRTDAGASPGVDTFTSVVGSCDIGFVADGSEPPLDLEIVRSGLACLIEVVWDVPDASPGRGAASPNLLSLLRLPPSLDRIITPVADAVSVAPTSQPAREFGQELALSLGHCGLGSPVDLDGSLWTPLAGIDALGGALDTDAEIGELINATAGQATFVSLHRLDLRTPAGSTIVFARHTGSRFYPICD